MLGAFARGISRRRRRPAEDREPVELDALKRQLLHQALHDPLTALPNRMMFAESLDEALHETASRGGSLAILLLDLSNFREVNDALGHEVGDLLLRQLGPRIMSVLPANTTVARFGGDEFVAMLPGTDESWASLAARKILRALETPFSVENHSVEVGGSIGVAVYPADGEDANTLLRRADVALFAAKHSAAGIAAYDPQHDQNSPERLALSRELRTAIRDGEIVLYYQPIVEVQERRLVGFEALARWDHPDRGLLPPDRFIPLAERSGLIKPLTVHVLHEALRQCRAWRDDGLFARISVNLSARMLEEAALPAIVAGALSREDLAPDVLTLEITESAIMEHPAQALEILSGLHKMGVRLTIDDFGTGYSSLAHLKRLPVDEIKIDKSFVIDITTNEGDAAISRSTIDLGHNLGLRVVAEGVETGEALAMLTALGCDVAQGYFVGRPMPAGAVHAWIEETSWLRRPDEDGVIADALEQLRRRGATDEADLRFMRPSAR